MQVSEQDGSLTLTLGEREDAPDTAILDRVNAALSRVKAVRVDASGCERIGTLALQALIVISQTADNQNVAFSMGDPADGFAAAVADSGLGPWMTAWRDD